MELVKNQYLLLPIVQRANRPSKNHKVGRVDKGASVVATNGGPNNLTNLTRSASLASCRSIVTHPAFMFLNDSQKADLKIQVFTFFCSKHRFHLQHDFLFRNQRNHEPVAGIVIPRPIGRVGHGLTQLKAVFLQQVRNDHFTFQQC
jgi:hypothetical protein